MKDSNTMPWVCDFAELDKTKLSWVGGKGANLGEMTQQGLPVPDGFCVTTSAYRAFLENGDNEQVEGFFQSLETLEVDDTQAVRKLGVEIRSHLENLPIPEFVEQAITEAWEQHGSEHFYAVRSSATAEDLPDASFAGQQDTYLNVKGRESVLEHVRRCWASLFTDRAIVYRARNQFAHKEVALSVVVQRMILPEVSGILFTVDPLTENRNVTSIDASYGLGEALVSGKVTPDLYKIDKRDGSILTCNIADKAMAIRPLPEGGTVEEKLTGELRNAQVLTHDQIRELASLGKQIEEHYGSPQDIEWCLHNNKFFIVQSRPITSLYPTFSHPHPEEDLQAYFCFNHLQVMTDPISPMGQSSIALLMPFGKWGQPPTAMSPAINSAGGRLYINVTKMLRNPKLRKLLIGILGIADPLTQLSIKDLVKREAASFDNKNAAKVSLPWMARNIGFPIMHRVMAFLWFRNTKGIVEHRTQFIEDTIEEMRQQLVKPKQGPAVRLRFMFDRMGRLFREKLIFNFMPVVGSALLSAKLIEKLTGKDFSDPDMADFMRAYEGNVTTDMDLELGDLADVARKYPAVLQHMRTAPVETMLDSLQQIDGGPTFLEEFQCFLKKYGARAASEIDIGRKRWREDPTPLLQMLIGNLANAEPGLHRKQHKELAVQALQAQERIIEAAAQGFWGWLKKRLVRRLTRVHRDLMGGREHPKWLMIQTFGLAKELLHEVADNLVERNELDHRDDIFFLDWDEVLALVENRWNELSPEAPARNLVAQRQANYERWDKLSPPRVLTNEGEIVRAELSLESAPAGAIIGSAASAGIIEGRARVIMSPKDAVLQHGEVLIAPFTDPGWTPLFIHAAGLVMEVGGLMTHGSVVAREYGIPAVVCVQNATTRIQTGQWIRVNGDQGFVEVLEEPENKEGTES